MYVFLLKFKIFRCEKMGSEGKYLLVVSITTGRNFPARNGKQLSIEGRFNDEVLSSDPVHHLSNPQINTGMTPFFNKVRNSVQNLTP